MQSKHQAQQAVVEHDARVLYASADDAAIEDHYVSHEYLVDTTTNQPLEPAANELWQMAYRMRKLGGVWKVVDGVKVVYGGG